MRKAIVYDSQVFLISLENQIANSTRLLSTFTLIYQMIAYFASCFHTLLALSILIGLFKLLKFFYTLLAPCFFFPIDFHKRYGGGQALITGASEGIGYAIAQELARKGFNLILTSRSLQKLQAARELILQVNPRVEVDIRSVDFEQLSSEEDYREFLHSLGARDISILVNNVGCYLPHALAANPYSALRREMRLNCLPPALLSRLLLPQLLLRQPRSALLTLSSAAATAAYPGSAHYSATKTFDDFLSLTLAQEYGSRVDVLTVRPFIVTTPMTRNTDSPIHCSARRSAQAIVQHLPRGGVTYGPLIHRLQGAMVEMVGGKIAGWVMGRAIKQFEEEYNKLA